MKGLTQKLIVYKDANRGAVRTGRSNSNGPSRLEEREGFQAGGLERGGEGRGFQAGDLESVRDLP